MRSIDHIVLRCHGDEAKALAISKVLLKDWYVFCSVTGEPISVADLKYWDVDRNEVYKDCETGLKRHQDLINEK